MNIIVIILVFITGVITGTVMMCIMQINRHNEYKRALAKVKTNHINPDENSQANQMK